MLNRRRCRILREEMNEGTGVFTIAAHLPAAEAFGLADELREHSAGAAAAQLMMSHWERLEVDPHFVPTTADELEEFGADAGHMGANLARRLMDSVRRRKGLPVEEKLVAAGTKQRTHARKR